MGSKTRLSSNCTKRSDNAVNLVTSRKTNARLARPINQMCNISQFQLEDALQALNILIHPQDVLSK